MIRRLCRYFLLPALAEAPMPAREKTRKALIKNPVRMLVGADMTWTASKVLKASITFSSTRF